MMDINIKFYNDIIPPKDCIAHKFETFKAPDTQALCVSIFKQIFSVKIGQMVS